MRGLGEGHGGKRVLRMKYCFVLAVAMAFSVSLFGCGNDAPADRASVAAKPIPSNAPRPSHGARVDTAELGFDYSTEDKRLQGLGIPSPAIRAYYHSLPDNVLEARAKAGEKFAKTFWVERLAREALTLQNARLADGSFPDGITEADAVGGIGQMTFHLSTLKQDPNNAMAGYLWGLTQAASIYGGPYEPIVAGIRLAGLRGDDRAVEFEREFRATHQNLDESRIEMYFDSGRRRMEMAARPRGP